MCKFYCFYLLTVYGLSAGAAQNRPNRCVLPEYPAHGTYTVHSWPEAVPGQAYDTAFLTVTCNPGYGVIGNNVTYCSGRNSWSQPMPRCTRFCRLKPDPSVKYFCKVTDQEIINGTRLCHEFEPHGTVVVPECNRDAYNSSSLLQNMRCIEGTWDHIAVCQPDCGTSTAKAQGMIIDGTRPVHGELPWHAGIYDKRYNPYKQVCGGSLVSTTTIISAAHCFWNYTDGLQQPASMYAAALGKIYRRWNEPMDPGAHKSDVREIKMPTRFMGDNGHDQEDIALVILSTPVVYVRFIRPVCIDFNITFDRIQLQSPNLGRVSGWGITAVDGRESPVLLTAELPYVDLRKCIDDLPLDFKPYVTSDKICAGSKNGSTVCKGDSGGGWVFPHVDGGVRRYYLRGVVSTAPTSDHKCNVHSYTTFTHILPHATFIKENGLGEVSVQDGPARVSGCVLPEYPAHGTYTVHDKPEAVPGQAYGSVLLTVTCDPGYRVVNTSSAFCIRDNIWSEPRPQCSRLVDVCTPSVIPPEINSGCCGVAAGGRKKRTSFNPSLGQYPWIGLVEYKKPKNTYFGCITTLISGRYALSAARCFSRDTSVFGVPTNVYLGEYDVSDVGHPDCVDEAGVRYCNDGASIIRIEKIIKHPDYRHQEVIRVNPEHDIALIKLKEIAPFTDFIRPICLPASDVTLASSQRRAMVAGWDLTSKVFTIQPGTRGFLRHVELPLFDKTTCQSTYASVNVHVPLESGHLCAGGEGAGACAVDIGAPLMYEHNNTFELTGIFSYLPFSCTYDGFPAVYSKVFAYINWIRENTVA